MKAFVVLVSLLTYSCFHEKKDKRSNTNPERPPVPVLESSTETATQTNTSTSTGTGTGTGTNSNTTTNTTTQISTNSSTNTDTNDDIDPDDPDLNNPRRRNFVLRKDKSWLRELTQEDLKNLKSPETIAALVDKVVERTKSLKNKSTALVEINLSPSQAQQVWMNYKSQWNLTKNIIANLPVQCRSFPEFTELSSIIDKAIINAVPGHDLESVRAIREPYLHVQNFLSFCRTQIFLEQASDTHLVRNMDFANKMLLHMFGDIFGKNSGFEGLAGEDHLRQRHYLFQALQKSLDGRTFIKDAAQANPGAAFISDSSQTGFLAPYPDLSQESLNDLISHSDEMIAITAAMGGSDFSFFERKFIEALNKLQKTDDYFYMQGGWTLHAINYEVRRDANGSYSFRVFNSGEGLDYHFSIDIPGRSLVFPYVEKRAVTRQSLLSKAFLGTLFSLKQYSRAGNNSSPDNLYKTVAYLLDGSLTTRAPSYEDYLDPQLAGTCAYYSVPYYYRSRDNSDKTYGDFLETNIQLKYLDDFFKTQRLAIEKFFTIYNMANKSLLFFSESVANAAIRGKKHIDAGFEKIAAEKIKSYYEILKNAFAELKKAENKSLASKIEALSSRVQSQYSSLQYRVPDRYAIPKILSNSTILSRENWQVEAAKLQADLNESISQILREITKHADFEGSEQSSILQTLLTMILKLPLNPEDLSFWRGFSEEEIGQLLFSLRRIDELYLWSLLDHIAYSTRDQRGVNPVEYLAQVKLLTVTDILLQLLKEKQKASKPESTDPVKLREFNFREKVLADIKSLHLPSIDPYINGQKIRFAIHDVAWNQEALKIKNYWQTRPVQDFFNLSDLQHSCRSFFLTTDDRKLYLQSVGGKPECPINDVPDVDSQPSDLNNLWQWVGSDVPRSAKTYLMFDIGKTKKEVYSERWGFEQEDSIFYRIKSLWDDSHPLVEDKKIPKLENDLRDILHWNVTDELPLALHLLTERPLSVALLGSNYFHLRSVAFVTEYFALNNFEKEAARILVGRFRFDSETANFETAESMLATVKTRENLQASSLKKDQYKPPISSDYDCLHHARFGWKCKWNLFGVAIKPSEGDRNASKLKPQSLDQAFAFNEASLDSLAEPLKIGEERVRRSTSEMVVTNFEKNKAVETFDTLRQLATVGQSQESQIQQAFGFFSENSYLLREQQWRTVYKQLEFDPGLLEVEATKNPILSQTLGKFCREQYNIALEDKDILHAVYFLRLNQYYKEHMQSLHKTNPKIRFEDGDFLNTRDLLVAAIQEKNPSKIVNNVIFRDLIRTYQFDTKFEKDDDLSWLYIAHIYRKLYPQEHYFEQDLENEIDGILLRKKDIIANYLKTNKAPLNTIVKFFNRGFSEVGGLWTIVGNICHLTGDAIEPVTLNLVSGEFLVGGGVLKDLPIEISHDPYFRAYVGIDFQTPALIDGYYDFYATYEGKRRHYRTRVESSNIIIQRKWGNRWYQHIPDKTVIDLTINREANNIGWQHPEMSLFPGFSHWVSVKESGPVLGFPEELAYNTQGKWDDEPEVLVFREKQSHLSMLVKLKSGWNTSVDKILKVSNDGKNLTDYEYHPISEDPGGLSSPYLNLFSFEHKRYTLVWRAAGKPDLIEFPRLNLELQYDVNRKEIYSEEYGLLQSDVVPDLINTKNALLFKNKKGVFNILVSQMEFALGESISLNQLQALTKIEEYGIANKNFFVYAYNRDAKVIRSFSVDSKLYLAYLYLLNANYEKSLSLLQELKSAILPFARSEDKEVNAPINNFSKRVQHTIAWIINARNLDADPRAIALRLRTVILALRDRQIFRTDLDIEGFSEKVAKDYHGFLQKSSRLDKSWLPEEEEIWLFYQNLLQEKRSDGSMVPFKNSSSFQLRYDHLVEAKLASISVGPNPLNLEEDYFSTRYHYESVLRYPRTKADHLVSVLQGGDLLAHLQEIYEIVQGWNGSVERKIRSLFSSLHYTNALVNPRQDFLGYLRAIYISNFQTWHGEKKFAISFIKAIENNKTDSMPSWNHLKSIAEEGYDYYSLSESQKTRISEFWYGNSATYWNTVFSGLARSESVSFDSAPAPNPEQYAKLTPVQFQKETNPYSQKLDFSRISTVAVQNYILEKPIISEEQLKDLLAESSLSPAQKAKIDSANDALKKVWSLVPGAEKNNEYAKKSVGKLIANLNTKADDKKKAQIFTLQAAANWDFRHAALVAESTRIQTLIDNSVDKITGEHGLANKEPSSWVGKAKRTLQEFAGLRNRTNLDQLLKIFATEDGKALFDTNSALESEDVKKILIEIKSFLILATYKQKLDSLLALMDKIDEDRKRGSWSDLIMQSELQNFKDQALQTRSYNLDEHPDYLAFEYFMQFLIRGEQKDALDRLNIKKRLAANPQAKGALYELIMGSGKTSVLLPLISYLNAGDSALSVVVFPESLLPSMSQQIADQMQSVFGRTIEVMDIKRSHRYTAEMVQDLLDRLHKALEKHTLVVMSNSSIQSLLLLFVEALKDPNKHDQLFVFKELFSFLKKYAFLTIDEVDSVLDIMKAHRFSVGKPVAFNKDAYYATFGLYNLVINDPEIRDSLDLPFLRKKSSKGTIFNEDYYESRIKKILIAKLVSDKAADILFFHDATDDLKKFYKELDKVELHHFLSSQDAQFNRDYLKKLKETNPVLSGFVATLYTQIHMVLPLTWGRLYKVHYGLYPREKCVAGRFCQEFIAIPYHSGTPLPESRFGSDLEALNYALQTHLEEANTGRVLQYELKRLKDSYGRSGAGKKRKARILERAKLFFPGITDSSFNTLQDEDAKHFAQTIVDKDPSLILNLLVYPLRSHLSVFNQQISTNALIYPTLFKRVQGMTGTMWNLNTMADFYDKDQVYLSDTIENTLMLLWSKTDTSKELNILDLKGDESLTDKMASLLKGRTDAVSIIDQGGLFRGLDQQQVARELVRSFPHESYKQVIFYDASHNLKLYNVDGSVKDYSPSVTDRNVTLAFWDIQHTTGSDLKINESGKAVMVVNKNTILRDLLQSAWRLRSLHRGQSVEFAISKSDLEYVKTYLKRYFRRDASHFTIGDLFFYTSMRELDQLIDQTYRSIHLNMDHEVIDSILSYVVDKNLSLDAYKGLYDLVKRLFEVKFPPFSYSLYGHPIIENPTVKILKEGKEDILLSEIVANLAGSAVDTNALSKKLDLLVKKGTSLLPPKVRSQSRAFDNQIEVETELELEVDVDTEVEQEIEQKIEMHQVDPNLISRGEWPWDRTKFFSGVYFDNPLSSSVLINEPIDELHTDKVPITLLKTALGIKTPKIASQFDSRLFISMNAAPVYKPLHNADLKPFAFFETSQKEFNDVLVAIDENGNLLNMTVISREETEVLGQWLVEERTLIGPSARRGFLIYSFGGNFYRFDKNVQDQINKNPNFLNELKEKALFINLIAQLKFLTGRSLLNEKELAAIDVFLENAGPAQTDLMDLFETYILKYKRKGQIEFQGSDLYSRFVELKKKYSKAKYFDLTNNFARGDEDERNEAKEKLLDKIRSGDKDSLSETEAMLTRLYVVHHNDPHSYPILAEALDLHIALVKKENAIDSAYAEMMDLLSEKNPKVHEKVLELGRQIFRQKKQAEKASLAYINTVFFGTSAIDSVELAKRMALLAETFTEDFFDGAEHCQEIVKQYLNEIFHSEELAAPASDPSVEVRSFLLKMASHETAWPVLKIEIDEWMHSGDAQHEKRAWWAYMAIVGSTVVLKSDDIQMFNELAKQEILSGDLERGLKILLALIQKKYPESLMLAFELRSHITDSAKKTELETALSSQLEPIFIADEKKAFEKTEYLTTALEWFVQKANTDLLRNKASDLLIKYAKDTRRSFVENVKRIAKTYFAKPEAGLRFVSDLNDARHGAEPLASLERVNTILTTYNSTVPAYIALQKKIAAEYLPIILDQMQYQVTADTTEAKLFQTMALTLVKHLDVWNQFQSWKTTQALRALTWASWLLHNNVEVATRPPELLKFVSSIFDEDSSAPKLVGALRILDYLVDLNDPQAIALSRESKVLAVRSSDDPSVTEELAHEEHVGAGR